MVCEQCGKATEMELCITCLRDLDPQDRYERFIQDEYKEEGEKVFKCPKCGGLDCIYGDFAINETEMSYGFSLESFKPKLKPTDTDMWCEYEYKGEIVQGNTLLDDIHELRFECRECGYDFDGQDDELNKNIVVIH
tara:strand:+ start:65 stop:472 length:408 start_codon:yes stop_codon:yes gene_type:complete